MSGARCEECGISYPMPPATVCVPCRDKLSELARSEMSNPPNLLQLGNCKKEKGEVEVDEQVQATSPLTTEVPAPPPSFIADEGPELYELEAAWRKGELEPVDVQLGEMPDWATPTMRAIADHMRLLMGLRLTRADDRPLPYALSMAIKAGIAANETAASRAIEQLARAGVIVRSDPLQPRNGLRGTNTFAPPAAAVQTLRRVA